LIWNFSGKSLKKQPLLKPRIKQVDNMKMYLREIGSEDREWVEIA
jgi:hypothetical protein